MRIVAVIIILFSVLSQAQQTGTWQSYSSMNNTNEILLTGSGIWAATGGGVYYFNLDDSSYSEYRLAQGISSHTITAIAIDETGNLWFGDDEGVINVLDPQSESVSKIKDISQTDNNFKAINDIFISGDTAFIATQFGLSLVNTESYNFMETVTKFGDLPGSISINKVLKSGLIYAALDEGIAIQKPGTLNISAPESWQSFEGQPNFSTDRVNDITFVNDTLFAATDNGIFYMNPADSSWTQFLFNGTRVYNIYYNGNSLYNSLSYAVYMYNGSSNNIQISFPSLTVNSFIHANNTLYAATTEGIYTLAGTDTNRIMPNGPFSNQFLSIDIAPNGDIWVGTGKDITGKGAYHFNGTDWTNYLKTNNSEVLSNSYHKVNAVSNNEVYLMNWGFGYTKVSSGSLTTFIKNNTPLEGVSENPEFIVIGDIEKDAQGNIWLLNHRTVSRNVLSVLTPDSIWYHFKFDSPFISQDESLLNLAIDQFGTKWFAVTDGDRGLYYFNENGTLSDESDDIRGFISFSDDITGDEITDIVVDKRGEIWAGTSRGIRIFTDPQNPQTRVTTSFPIRQQSINAIAVDPLNRKWVGTSQGVYLLSSDGTQLLESYDKNYSPDGNIKPIPNDNITSIAFDDNNGIVYIGTDYGMAALKTDAQQPKDNFEDIFVYPNPFEIDGEDDNLTIKNLVEGSEIKVLTITGKLISESFNSNINSPGGNIAIWDGKDKYGKLVPSGIYIIAAYDEEANNVGIAKVAVIRK